MHFVELLVESDNDDRLFARADTVVLIGEATNSEGRKVILVWLEHDPDGSALTLAGVHDYKTAIKIISQSADPHK